MPTKLSEHAKRLLLLKGKNALRGKKIVVQVLDINRGAVQLSFQILGPRDACIAEIASVWVDCGDKITLTNIDHAFTLTLV